MHTKNPLVLVLLGMILHGLCPAQPTQLGIDRNAGPARITLQGQSNRDYSLVARDVASTNWNFLATLTLSNAAQSWFDADSMLMSSRFYRAVQLPSPTIPEHAEDFRLIDHQGVSRSPYYYQNATSIRAFVFIFTGNGCARVQQLVPAIKSLRDQFAPQGVIFWMIDANPADNRSNLVTEANAFGIDLPILHDRAQLVARTYHATSTPEVVCVSKSGWSIFYRGTLDDRLGSNPAATTQAYLANALTSFLAGGTVTPRQTQTKGCAIPLTTLPTPSYSTDVAPLLLDKCVRCHSDGNIAPFAMADYAEIQFRALQIRGEILAGRMPPWHADPLFGNFTNDNSLSPTQAAMVVKWIDDGAPRGNGPDPLATAPVQTNYPFGWPAALGTPDIIVPIGTETFAASGTIPYVNKLVPYAGPTTWLRAAVILPGSVRVVHHISAGIFGQDNNVAQSWISLYVPGVQAAAYPAGTGRLLNAGANLYFQLHYTADGTTTSDSSLLGLYTNAVAPASPLTQTSIYTTSGWSIPPNTNDYAFARTNSAFTSNVWLYEVYPHMHTRGVRAKYEALYPNGTSEVLLSVPRYEFHWQTSYRFAQPKFLPVGTKIRYTCAWDNSVLNEELVEQSSDVTNPDAPRYSPTRTVGWGEQTYDEMFIGYYNYSVAP